MTRTFRLFLSFIVGTTVPLATIAYAAVPPSPAVVIERTAARFWAPEMGGFEHPHFATDRDLRLGAWLVQIRNGEASTALTLPALKSALDQIVGESLLAGAPVRPADEPVRRALQEIFFANEGGREKIVAFATELGISSAEVSALADRWATAILALNRQTGTIYSRAEEVLTAAKEAEKKGEARMLLRRQLFERGNDGISTFLQQARSHVTIILTHDG